jgi:hypothetical protein
MYRMSREEAISIRRARRFRPWGPAWPMSRPPAPEPMAAAGGEAAREERIARAQAIIARGWMELAWAYAEGRREAAAALPREPGTGREAAAAPCGAWHQEEIEKRHPAEGSATLHDTRVAD